jgi:hypothetical protein
VAVAAYPGTFNPPTVAHLAIATAAWEQAGLERVDLIISAVALGKEDLARPTVAERLAVLAAVGAGRPWLAARATEAQLLVDVAAGYDALILGADKWAQIADPAWYGGSPTARDEALARLPPVLVAPRPPFPLPSSARVLDLDETHHAVSSTAVRAGRRDWMLPEAADFARRSGLWGPRET